jgi:coenzyme F420-0:L-glutamate ligase/coenzyme F420-1:gamma-L-glutamate ligase
MTAMTLTALENLPEVRPGDDLAHLLIEAIERHGINPARQDVVVVAQKIVSKAEGRYVRLDAINPSATAIELADRTGKDARLVHAILDETEEVLRVRDGREGLILVVHRLGHVMANGGVDQSNLGPDGEERALLLPGDPDASAARLKARFDDHFKTDIGVVVSDSVGRAWRMGTIGMAIGAAGLPSLVDWRGTRDRSGRPLRVTMTGFADAIAAAAVLAMGEAAEGRPAVHIRGLAWTHPPSPAAALVRPKHEDLFR